MLPERRPLKPGDRHYKAYVGPPEQYDLMGATQFRLLCALGLRAEHRLLDVGCGSLRAGKLFISYLDAERYFGIEPNAWLVEEGIRYQLGDDLVQLKRPGFSENADFRTDEFGCRFDFILAQSVFSHAGSDLIREALKNFRNSLMPGGLIAVTFIEAEQDFSGEGWIYPDCVAYRPATLSAFAAEAGLLMLRIPWHHPRQTWYLLAGEAVSLPDKAMLRHLTGAVLRPVSPGGDRWVPASGCAKRWQALKKRFARKKSGA